MITGVEVMNQADSLPADIMRKDWTASIEPSAKTADDVGDRLQPHALRSLRGKRRARSAGAEEYEFPVRREHRLVILAGRVEPEFQHATRAMERTWNTPLAVELADVAQGNQCHLARAEK